LQSNTFSSFLNGQKIITFKSISSTNDYFKVELSKSTPFNEGTVIMAEEQFGGRGQSGNEWLSEAGKNLTFSILLKPSFLNPLQQFNINIAICVAIYKALHPILGEELSIKWPNDVFVGDRKLGGVLIENILQGSEWRESIVGIGINVNQEHFPEVKNACSLKVLLHHEYILTDLLYELCKSIDKHYSQLKNHGISDLQMIYKKSLYGLNQTRKFNLNGVYVEGKIIDVADDGQLIVDFNGHSARFNFKEIEFVF
jgi:BirA family biotin operon repressor/biotin-[acetyl-CoA-carboxylase] ligase